jgi:multisubunit Na+/H+ antiporter MnhB subunit
VLVAGYLLWLGTAAAGGAFQAGVVLAAACVLLWFAGWRGLVAAPGWLSRTLVLAGVGAFLAAALLSLAHSGVLLHFPAAQAGAILLLLESFATLSIAVTLTALTLAPQGGPPAPSVPVSR